MSWTKILEDKLESVRISLYCDGGYFFPKKRLALVIEDAVNAINDYCPGEGKLKIEFLGANDYSLYVMNGGRDQLIKELQKA